MTIKTINYLRYINLPDSSPLSLKLSVLLDVPEKLIDNYNISEIFKILKELQDIEYDQIKPHLQLPVNYNSITFGEWADIEEFEKDGDDELGIFKQIAVLMLGKDRTIEQVINKAQELSNLNVKEGLPLLYWHTQKKKNLGIDFPLFTTLRVQALQVSLVEKMKLENNGVGMQLQVQWFLHPWKWILCLRLKLKKYLLGYLIRINLHKLNTLIINQN